MKGDKRRWRWWRSRRRLVVIDPQLKVVKFHFIYQYQIDLVPMKIFTVKRGLLKKIQVALLIRNIERIAVAGSRGFQQN